MEVLRRSSYARTAWKNGGGTTFEVIRVPADTDDFGWRLSLAQIEKSGPFSDFSGYERTMVLLDGGGVLLRFANRPAIELHAAGDMVEFDGGQAPSCRLLGGPCTDLNLIVSARMSRRTQVRRSRDDPDACLSCVAGETVILVPIDGEVVLEADHQAPAFVQPWDTAILSSDDRARWRAGAGKSGPMMFVAAVGPVHGAAAA